MKLIATCLILTRLLLSQSLPGAAGVEGYVTDPTESYIQSAQVSVLNLETGYTRRVVTDLQGRFSVLPLPTGRYSISVIAPGFVPESMEVTLAVGKTETLLFRLQLEAVTEQVAVRDSADSGHSEPGSSSTLLSSRMISDLPIRSRRFADFVQLSPAVVQEHDRLGLVIAGQRSINSNVAVDGADFNDPLQGNQRGGNESAFFFPQGAVKEFQVVRSGATAETGRTSAGFVNAVTRSGGNELHGELFYFNRNRHLTASDAFGRSLDNSQHQFGGSLGGPLARDRAFFFLSLEQNFIRTPFVVEFETQANLPPELLSRQGEFHGTNNPTVLFGRTDFRLDANHLLTADYSFSRLRGENFNFDSPRLTAATETNFTRRTRSNAWKTALTSVLSPIVVNEWRFQYATDFRLEEPNTFGPEIVIKGVGTIGGDSGRPRRFDAARYQLADNLTSIQGRHNLRLGFDWNATPSRQEREANLQGKWEFKSLADYLDSKPNRFRQTIPGRGFDPEDLIYRGTQKELAVFVTDQICLHRRLKLDAGLRWEGQWNPDPTGPNPLVPYTGFIPDDLSMWQPRLGLAWDVSGQGSTVIRLSSGLYSARTPATLFQRVFTDNGLATLAVDLKSTALQRPGFPLHFPDVIHGIPVEGIVTAPRVFGFDPAFRNPRTFQSAASVERRLASHFVVSAEYLRASTWWLQRRLDRNLFPPEIDGAGTPIFRKNRPLPGVSRLSVNESSAHSSFEGLILSVASRASRRYQFQAHYTLSRNRDDDSNERNFGRETALNPFDLQPEAAPSKQDVRHNFNLSGLLELPKGFTAGAILSLRTGLPYTAIIGADLQNDENEDNDRAVIEGRVVRRNSFRQPSFASLDLRLLKAVALGERTRLEFIAEAFNLTRHSNKNFGNDGISEFGAGTDPFPSFGVPLFAPSTARFGGPRQVQLGVKLAF